MTRTLLPLLSLIFLAACGTARKAADSTTTETVDLPELVITPEEEDAGAQPYRAAEERPFDLLHTALDLSFDLPKRHVHGKALLRMTPLAYPQQTVTLDAVGFLLHDVRLDGAADTLAREYDGRLLTLRLPRQVRPGDTLSIRIEYTARPDENPVGGSEAIRQDKGLYFIDPTDRYRDLPTQIWTQGETEANSRWFPTFDQPNERCTQEVRVTVDSVFETLSNGLLVARTANPDGTRTDTWRMDQPHAPYLFMLAIGDYAVSGDTWRGIPLGYYVEKPYADHATAIFPDAPAQLSFFSDYTGVPYPWPKYSQVVVREFVSGAMENTTAVIYGDFVQSTTRELVDERRNELICAHELIHHWFGDLVTCESWSNLVLNEGFANYGEYLWLEHKYGPDEAEYHRRNELEGYLSEASQKRRPVVDFHYANREDMFDAHSYNKGGLILHMLRRQLGEAAFRAGIRTYLQQHAWQPVEIHDLRLAFERASGRDLNGFFDQWYLRPGHPSLEWSWTHDAASGMLTLNLKQTQDSIDNAAVYTLPTEIAVLLPGDKLQRLPLVIDQREMEVSWDLPVKPLLVDLDPDRVLLMEQTPPWARESLHAYYRMQPHLWTRQDILLLTEETIPSIEPRPWGDVHWSVRHIAVEGMDAEDPEQAARLDTLARKDPHSEVRAAALGRLADAGYAGTADLAADRLRNDPSYAVVQAALQALSREEDPTTALFALAELERDSSVTATLVTGSAYAGLGRTEKLSFFTGAWERVGGYARIAFMRQYAQLLQEADDETLQQGVQRLALEVSDVTCSPLRRFIAFRMLGALGEELKESRPEAAARIEGILEAISETALDEDLLQFIGE